MIKKKLIANVHPSNSSILGLFKSFTDPLPFSRPLPTNLAGVRVENLTSVVLAGAAQVGVWMASPNQWNLVRNCQNLRNKSTNVFS